jgi:hypothetical protein
VLRRLGGSRRSYWDPKLAPGRIDIFHRAFEKRPDHRRAKLWDLVGHQCMCYVLSFYVPVHADPLGMASKPYLLIEDAKTHRKPPPYIL